jgi:hypothetical protein
MTALIVRRGRMVTEGVPMAHLQASVERAMKVQEVIVRALAGQLTWLQATDILGRSPAVSAACGGGSSTVAMTACSIVDGGPRRPSAPVPEVQRVLALYRDRYPGVQRPPLPPARPPAARRAAVVQGLRFLPDAPRDGADSHGSAAELERKAQDTSRPTCRYR